MSGTCILRRWLLMVVGSVALVGTVSGGEFANPHLCQKGQQLLLYFRTIYGKQILAGYNVYPHTPDDYQQTGRHAAIWGRDIQWLKDVDEVIAHVQRHGYILTLHWHWFFGGDSAWTRERKTPVVLDQLLKPGTPEHDTLMRELSKTADVLEKLQQAGIVVLWRPLHEIDGGWFWWTDLQHPENTAELWRVMFRYFTEERKLNNLIWVYSAGVGDLKKKPPEWRRRFYPGDQYVDIAGIDIYGVDLQQDETPYWDYFRAMEEICPGKTLALCECDAIPNPDKMAAGKTPCWLYALPWWGCPHPRRSVDWARFTMGHPQVITLDELPLFDDASYVAELGILRPADDGGAWFPNSVPVIEGFVAGRGSPVDLLQFLVDDKVVAEIRHPPRDFSWTWPGDLHGTFELTARAYDAAGKQNLSNRIHIAVGVRNAARSRSVRASSGTNPEAAVDGSYYSGWHAAKDAEDAWIEVDLGSPVEISQVNLIWGWKIHPAKFAVEISRSAPDDSERSWETVSLLEDLPWQPWKATHRVRFAPRIARVVRVHAYQRAAHQTWAGYDLAEIEIPIPAR